MSKKLEQIREYLKLKNHEAAQHLLEQVTNEYAANPFAGCAFAWPFEELARLYRKQKEFAKEIRVLSIYVACAGQNPAARHQWHLIDRLEEATRLAARYVPGRGLCEMCDKSGRVLTRIDSGQVVCKTCLQELAPPPRPAHLATSDEIKWLRRDGFNVPDDLAKEEVGRLYGIQRAQSMGLNVSFNSTQPEIDAAI